MSKLPENHQRVTVHFALITVSDTRTEESDDNYHYLKKVITDEKYIVDHYTIVKDEAGDISGILKKLAEQKVQVIVINGGTGISRRDTTFDVISGLLEKVLTGFGEIFRYLSYEQVGSAAMLSRATAGLYKESLVFSLPGSPKAVSLAWEQLIKPQIQHLVFELNK